MFKWLSGNLLSQSTPPSTPPPDSRRRDAQLHQTPTRLSDASRVQSCKVQVVTPPRTKIPATNYPSPSPTPRRAKKESHTENDKHSIYPSLKGLEAPSVPTSPRNKVDSVQNRLPSPLSDALTPLPTPPPSSSRPSQVLQAYVYTPTRRRSSSRNIAPISSFNPSPSHVGTTPPTPSSPVLRPKEAGRSGLPSGSRASHPAVGQQPPQQRKVDPSPTTPTPGNGDSREAFKMRKRLLATGEFENGQRLTEYQLADLKRLVAREAGEKVCNTEVVNRTGFLLAYDMGLGKTVMSIALIVCNPPPKSYEGAKATLVVVPSQGIMNLWKTEIQKFAPHLSVCFYNSISTPLDPDADVVLMTYAQLRLQHGAFEHNPKDPFAPIFHHSWYRQINDEAHNFRNPTKKTARAVLANSKIHGLCLTGTPVQNTLLDFYSYFRFLDVTYDGVHDQAVFESKIYSQKQEGPIVDKEAEERLELIKKHFCIFRAKNDVDPETGNPLVKLPTRTDFMVDVDLSHQERQIYACVQGMRLHVFAKWMRLRQVCDHPALLRSRLEDAVGSCEIEGADEILGGVTAGSDAIALDQLPSSSRPLLMNSFKSSKIKAMLRILREHKDQKTIVFTHFTSLIPAIAEALIGANIRWAQYTGDMSAPRQIEALTRIAEDEDCTVIVVSIRAGGVGLNITSCNNVILMEPWWNPYVEEQAISRAHRIGQTLPVNVYRLVARNSIEERILETQQLKREMVGDMYGDANQNPCGRLNEATQRAWLEKP